MQTPQAIHGQPCVNTQGSTQASLGMFVADWLSHLVIASRASQGLGEWVGGFACKIVNITSYIHKASRSWIGGSGGGGVSLGSTLSHLN